MNILGISAYYHDSAACLVVGNDFLRKENQPESLRENYQDLYELD